MLKILRQRAHGGPAGPTRGGVAGGSGSVSSGVRRPGSTPGETSRRSSTSRPTTDILSHLQELKAQERQVLSRGSRDALPATPTAGSGSGGPAGVTKPAMSAEELKSRQERQAREERLAHQYREQLQTRLQEISDSAIDLGYQKTLVTQFERQLLGSSSPRELEQLELERVNGVRSLIGLPALPPPAVALGSSGSVRQSRPGTPMYATSSPSHIPSPAPYPPPPPPPPPPYAYSHKSGPYRSQHRRTTSYGSHAGGGAYRAHGAASRPQATRARDIGVSEDDEVQDMDLELEEGEISEEGELLE
ncbi:hypothetical protein LPJ70_000436 [Coemansia sp. RSA 2708]|nr:hypothetical protein LPJ70_000436 [Coemansia sp. RSA 2708]